MLKGVNKTVIEVKQTGNEVFEKVVFYVSPKYVGINERELRREADDIIKNYSLEDCDFLSVNANRSSKKPLFLICAVALVVAVGVLAIII